MTRLRAGIRLSCEACSSNLEFLLRQEPKWKVALQNILFKEGDIVKHGEEAEKAEEES